MILIDNELCVQCGMCIRDCVDSLIRLKKGNIVGPKECLECGHCVAVCPKGAVTMADYDMSQTEPVGTEPILDPQKVLSAIKSRRSIRQYQEKKITGEDLEMLLEAGRYTATAKNTQGNQFVFVQEQLDELKALVWNYIEEETAKGPAEMDPALAAYFLFAMKRKKDPSNDYLFRNAPAMMLVVTENEWDAGLASQNIETMANALGMGVLYNGYLMRLLNDTPKLKEWLGIGEQKIATAMLIGYQGVKYQRTAPRKDVKVIRK